MAIAMTGVALGDRLLCVGCTDSSLLGAIGSKVGLSGRICAVVPNEIESARAIRAAEKTGFLLDLEMVPGLIHIPFEERVGLLQAARRTLQPRGRIVIIERGPRPGLGALFRPANTPPVDPHYQSSGGAITALQAEGFRAARLLAERNGLSFFEGVR